MRLADLAPTPGPGRYGGYFLELSTGWHTSKSTITIDLRKAARWQDGARFTSKDVITSILLAGANANSAWTDIESLSSRGPDAVVVHLTKGAVPQNVLSDLLQMPMVPNSEYVNLVPKGFQHDLTSYWETYDFAHPTTASIGAASASPAGKAITEVESNLVKFAPKRLLGDGPYTLAGSNATSVLFKKWPGWWNAKVIRIPYIDFLATSGANAFGSILNGSLDFQTGFQAFTDPQAQRLDSVPGEKYVVNPGNYQQFVIMFHTTDYPFNLLSVRQAIAYVINRPTLAKLDFGGSLLQQPPTTVPDGLVTPLNQKYLSPAQRKSLNPYRYSPTKASALLRGAGFAKKGSTWYTPKGKPFSFTITMPEGNPPIDNDALSEAKMLDTFGIKASASAIETTTFATEQEQGAYPISMGSFDANPGIPLPGNPIQAYQLIFDTYNYPATYSGIGSCHCSAGMAIGPTAQVPGLGKVNIAAALDSEVAGAPVGTWSRYAYDWARYIDKELPFIQVQNNTYHKAYSEQRYVDWPPASDKHLWDNGAPQLLVMMEAGYLKPKKG